MNFGRDYHCGLIGYLVKKKPRASEAPPVLSHSMPHSSKQQPVTLNKSSPAIGSTKAVIERAERSIPNPQRKSEQGTSELKSQLSLFLTLINVIQHLMPCLGIGLHVKRKRLDELIDVEKEKRRAVTDAVQVRVWVGNL
jgi:hypothetical protein